MATRVYKFGLLRPIDDKIVRDQMSLAHRYRNTLTEIYRGARSAKREAQAREGVAPLVDAVARQKARVDELVTAVKSTRSAARSRSESDDLRAQLKEARSASKLARSALSLRRAEIRDDESYVAVRDEIHERFLELRRNARSYSGLRHGTYTLVESAAEKASTTTPMFNGAEPQDPRFQRWSGDATIGVQIQGGVTVGELTSCADTRLQLSLEGAGSGKADPTSRRSATRRRCVLRVRVGSNPDRSPVWAEWPMVMHRPFPDGSVVKFAAVSCRMVGPTERWTVEFTCAIPDESIARGSTGAAAVDLGWRLIGDEIRVAVAVGDDGERHELRMPARMVAAFHHVEALRSQRDKNRDAMLADLIAWARIGDGVPAHVAAALPHMHLWKAPRRLVGLLRAWPKAERDCDTWRKLEAWRYHDHHMWTWESHARSNALDSRKHLYRTWAARLSRRYATVVLERFDLRTMAVRPKTAANDDVRQNETARGNRQIAAPSEARLSLRNVFVYVQETSAVKTTMTCPVCGLVESWDAAASITHACGGCGAVRDQDEGAAVVLLGQWQRERLSAEQTLEGARDGENGNDSEEVKETRWQRVARMRAEKEARMDAARNGEATAAE